MRKQLHNRGLYGYMTATGPFQSQVVKKVIFCFDIVNYFFIDTIGRLAQGFPNFFARDPFLSSKNSRDPYG